VAEAERLTQIQPSSRALVRGGVGCVDFSQGALRCGIFRPQFKRLANVRPRLLELAHAQTGFATDTVGIGKLGIDLNRLGQPFFLGNRAT
jgi:hypothetical protein